MTAEYLTQTPYRWRIAQATQTRRAVLRNAAVAGTALFAAPTLLRRSAQAQGLTGKITVGLDGSNAAMVQVVEAAADAVRAANPQCEIQIEAAPGGNWETQLFLALASGKAPDVFIVTGLGVGELSAAGYLEPLDGYLGGWDGWAQYPDVVRRALTYQNQVWALPCSIDTHFFYYRKDLLEKAGLAREWQPASPDDILATARNLKSAAPDVMSYGIYAGANGGNGTAVRGFLPLVYAFGGSLTDETGRWIIDSPALRGALAHYETAFQVDKTAPSEIMTSVNPPRMMRTAIAAGEMAMLYDGSWVYADWDAAVPDITRQQIGYTQYPTADGRPPFAVGGLGNSWYINVKAGARDLAWALLMAGNVPEVLTALNVTSPHIPPRLDAAGADAFKATEFHTAMVGSISNLIIAPPDPAYRQLIGVIQNATGIVATGEATPEAALKKYADELTRILGEDRVVSQS
jgi:multiple sugar transport system substrate-binding protein